MNRADNPSVFLRTVGVCRSFRPVRLFGRGMPPIQALENASLEIRVGATLGIVGNSGSGKSTLARCLAALDRPDEGEIWLDGIEFGHASENMLRFIRPQLQLILQDAATALNPRMTAVEIVSEPLRIQGSCGKHDCRDRALTMMARVGLQPDWKDRFSSQFSGGQRQRLAIARALVLDPRLLILDEALSGLDVPLQVQLLDLLRELQQQSSISYVMISHDPGVVAGFAEEVLVMAGGRIVRRETSRAWIRPRHAPAGASVGAGGWR
jgi:ABC-type glutathione transport system ATPase component